MTPDERITKLEGILAEQRHQLDLALALNAVLAERVHELEARLAKDSHNSSKPPSSDGLARKTKSLRRRSGKKPGGQIGHRGETLRLVATPDAVVEHRPVICSGCQTSLADEAPVVLRERRQVQELPPVRLQVTEHQALHVRCPACQTVTAGTFPAKVPSRAQYGPRLRALAVYLVEQQLVPYGRVRELLGRSVRGSRSRWGPWWSGCSRLQPILEPVEAQIKAALSQAPVLHSDETGVRQAGQLAWAHVASTQQLTHYASIPSAAPRRRPTLGSCRPIRASACMTAGSPIGPIRSCRHALFAPRHAVTVSPLQGE